jgi:hypothetical protein
MVWCLTDLTPNHIVSLFLQAIRSRTRLHRAFYLSQHEDPSSGCAQHAPLFSSFVWLGVQQTEVSFLGVQQDEATVSVFPAVILLFCITGMSEFFVSIV